MTIKTSWDEVNLEEYLEICKIELDKKFKNSAVSKSLAFAAVLSNKSEKEIGQMNREMFLTILEKISFVVADDPTPATRKPFKIGKVNYIFHPEFNRLTAGEMVSIETIIKDATKEERTFLPEILAILIRPAIKVKSKEGGTQSDYIAPFDVDEMVEVKGRSVNILEYRRRLFMKELLVPHFLTRLTAFMDGANRSKIITSLSSVRKNHLAKRLENAAKDLEKKNH